MRQHRLANESYCPGSNMPIADMEQFANVNVANGDDDLQVDLFEDLK